MILFFDDEADYIRHYVNCTEEDGWECKMTPTIEQLLESLAAIEARDTEMYDEPNVVVVDIMMPTATGIAKDIQDKLNVGIYVIEEWPLRKLRSGNIWIVVLTNRNPALVQASLREIGVADREIPVWAKHDVAASIFPQRLQEFLDSQDV